MKLIKAKKYLCMLLAAMLVSAAAIGVNAEELITGVGDWLVDIGISEDDYPVKDELVPQAATACPGVDAFDWSESHHNIHFQDDKERDGIHTVFSESAANELTSMQPSQAMSCVYSAGNSYLYTYSYVGAGYVGGKNGDGAQCDYIMIVVKPSGKVITIQNG